MHVSLEDVKEHLNIDQSYKADDAYLVGLIDVCEKAVERSIDLTLDALAAQHEGEVPAPIVHAVKLLIGNFYANRESIAFAQAYQLPKSFDFLLDLYRNYACTVGGGSR